MSHENPYQVSNTIDQPPAAIDPKERLRAIAKAQRSVNLATLAYLCIVAATIALAVLGIGSPEVFIATRIAVLVVMVIGAVTVYRLASLLRGKVVAVLYVVGLLFPCLGLVLLLTLSQKATSTLQAAGVRVGLLGADPSSI